MDHIFIRVQEQIEQEYLQRLRRDIRTIEHLRYVSVFPKEHAPLISYKVEGDIGECAICQEYFRVGEEFIPLPCNQTHPHKFHKGCIRPWLRGHDTCPVCRGKV